MKTAEASASGMNGPTTNGITESPDDVITNGQGSPVADESLQQGLRRKEVVRLIVQALQGLGYSQSAVTLEKESGYPLETPAVAQFREGVSNGDWAHVESLLPSLDLAQTNEAEEAKFLLREQKYLELLETRQIKKALVVLRNELAPLNRSTEKLHMLSSLMMCSNVDDLKTRARWDGAGGTSRQRLLSALQTYISPAFMVPEHRLETLLEQATALQRLSCLYHNADARISLYSDHVCPRSQFPSVTKHIFEGHSDEVWYVAFSRSGKYLASASKDKTVIIWSMEIWEKLHVLEDHLDWVSFVSWSPDDSMILTCGLDNLIKLWNVQTATCMKTLKVHTEPVAACAWLPDGKSFVSGSQDRNIIIWAVDGSILHQWTPGPRIVDLAINTEGTKLVAICHEKKIHIYDLVRRVEEGIMEEDYQPNGKVTSICISNDCKYALLNLTPREIHLWDLQERRLIRKYFGHKQRRYVIRSCFGGIDQGFVISGSEDSNIYVWHREHTTLIEVLSGHTGAVNSVNWNPVDPYMFASAADDNTIRIWGREIDPDPKGKMRTIECFPSEPVVIV